MYKDTLDFEISAMDSDQTMGIQIRNDEKMKDN